MAGRACLRCSCLCVLALKSRVCGFRCRVIERLTRTSNALQVLQYVQSNCMIGLYPSLLESVIMTAQMFRMLTTV